MPIEIDSTTDTQEMISAAMGGKSDEVVEEQETAESQETDDENKDESATSNDDQTDENQEDQDDDIDDNDDDENDDDEDEKSDDQEKEKPKKRNRVEKRIKKLSKQKNDAKADADKAKAEAEYWRNLVLKNQNQQETPQEKTEQAPRTEDNGKPNPDEYDSHEDYIDALTDWKVDNKLSAKEKQDQEQKLKEESHSKRLAFQKKVQEFAATVDDFEEVIESVDDIFMSPTVEKSIGESDDGPKLMYELANNREEYERINQMSPLEAARAIGRFEAKLIHTNSEEKKETKTLKTSKAPKPVKTLSKVRSSGSSKNIFDQDLSQSDYEKMRFEQMESRSSF